MSLSPEMIRQVAEPSITKIADAFGGTAYVHFCSLDEHRFEHVYEGLADLPAVCAASSQFGFTYYAEHLEQLRGRLAIEAFYGGAFDFLTKSHGGFARWAREFVPRFKNESGLVLYFEMTSVDEARRIWEIWQKAHEI